MIRRSSDDRTKLAFSSLLDSYSLVSTHAENPEHRSEALLFLEAEYGAIAASMNTPKAKAGAKCAFDSGPEVFRSKPLKTESPLISPIPSSKGSVLS